MKRVTLLLGTLLLFGTLAAGVVDENRSTNGSDGDMHIMDSGSSASASTAVSEDGEQWSASVQMQNSTCHTGEEDTIHTIENDEDTRTVMFTGQIPVSNPCHTVDHDIVEVGPNEYVMNVTTHAEDGMCTQCLGVVTYDAEFTAQDDYTLTVQHDGETVDELDMDTGESVNQQGSFLSGLINWFNNLF